MLLLELRAHEQPAADRIERLERVLASGLFEVVEGVVEQHRDHRLIARCDRAHALVALERAAFSELSQQRLELLGRRHATIQPDEVDALALLVFWERPQDFE